MRDGAGEAAFLPLGFIVSRNDARTPKEGNHLVDDRNLAAEKDVLWRRGGSARPSRDRCDLSLRAVCGDCRSVRLRQIHSVESDRHPGPANRRDHPVRRCESYRFEGEEAGGFSFSADRLCFSTILPASGSDRFGKRDGPPAWKTGFLQQKGTGGTPP